MEASCTCTPARGDPSLVLLYGFPSSSFDWRCLLDKATEQAALAFDFLGLGLSDKLRDGDCRLFHQADLTLELMRNDHTSLKSSGLASRAAYRDPIGRGVGLSREPFEGA